MENEFSTFSYEGLRIIPWGVFEMLLVVGRNHHLVGKKGIRLDDLKEEEWILFEKGSWLRNITHDIFCRHDIAPKNIFKTNDGATIFSMVKDGQGITMLPGWGIIEDLKSGNLISIQPENFKKDVPISIVISSRQSSKLVNAFVDFLLGKQMKGLRLHKKSQNSSSK